MKVLFLLQLGFESVSVVVIITIIINKGKVGKSKRALIRFSLCLTRRSSADGGESRGGRGTATLNRGQQRGVAEGLLWAGPGWGVLNGLQVAVGARVRLLVVIVVFILYQQGAYRQRED